MSKSKIKCFFLEPTEYMQISLRRYKGAQDGQPLCNHTNSYHDANVVVVPMVERPKDQNTGRGLLEHPDYPRDDPRWPKECPCGFKFGDDAHWQVNERILFSSPEMNGLITIDDAPVGAMWDAWWYDHKGPDGRCLVLRTPGGDWIIDYPCEGGKGWERTGEPPNITANPSIGIGMNDQGQKWKYHGWLRDGYLVEC
jgi:hypothetical protein